MKKLIELMLKEKDKNIRISVKNPNETKIFLITSIPDWIYKYKPNYKGVNPKDIFRVNSKIVIQIYDKKEKVWYETYEFVIPINLFNCEKKGFFKNEN